MSCLQSLFTEHPRKTALVSALCWSVLLSCQQLGSGGVPRGAQGVSTHERLLAPGHRQCYFFPRTPTGHFPGEGFLAECVGTAPFSCLQRAQSRPVGTAEISAWDQHFPSPLAHNKLQTKQLGLGGSPAIPFQLQPRSLGQSTDVLCCMDVGLGWIAGEVNE